MLTPPRLCLHGIQGNGKQTIPKLYPFKSKMISVSGIDQYFYIGSASCQTIHSGGEQVEIQAKSGTYLCIMSIPYLILV